MSALAELIEERPYHEITVNEIAARAGATRPVFYFYFPTKGAALAAVLGEFTEQLLQATKELWVERDTSPRVSVAHGTRHTVELWSSHARRFVALLDAEASDPEAARAWADFRARMAAFIAPVVEQERADGVATEGPPAATYVRILLGMNWQAFETEVRQIVATGQRTPGLAEALTEIWIRALYEPLTGLGTNRSGNDHHA